jgi:hypothetical protein
VVSLLQGHAAHLRGCSVKHPFSSCNFCIRQQHRKLPGGWQLSIEAPLACPASVISATAFWYCILELHHSYSILELHHNYSTLVQHMHTCVLQTVLAVVLQYNCFPLLQAAAHLAAPAVVAAGANLNLAAYAACMPALPVRSTPSPGIQMQVPPHCRCCCCARINP